MPADALTARHRPGALPVAQRLARAVTRTTLSTRATGLELVPTHGPVIIAGNHTGFLDGPLVTAWAPRPLRTLTKVEIFHGVTGRAMSALGQIPVDRSGADRYAMTTALEVLAAGGAIGVFPEGTRGDGELTDIKDGIGYLAIRSRAPIVPVAVIGTQQVLPKGAKIPRRGTDIVIAFGPPWLPVFEGDAHLRRSVTEAAEVIRRHLRAHLEAVRRSLLSA